MNLPPLPEPFINLDNTPGAKLAWGAQMLAYGDARAEHARKQALEEAAQLCDVSKYEDWEIRCGAEGRAIYTDVQQAIRSIK